jgi:hypothetical protein
MRNDTNIFGYFVESFRSNMQRRLLNDDAVENLPAPLQERTKGGVPLDIALSMLKPDELEKLKKYIVSYLVKYRRENEG